MKFLLFAICALESASALQSSYLSQLNGGATHVNGGSPAFVPRSVNDQPPNGAFFPAPTASMGDLYTSAPPSRNASPNRASAPSSAAAPSAELLKLWSDQVSVELSASQLYLSASIWFRTRGLDGMAAWMLEESGEERGHGLAILEFAMKKGFHVELNALAAPRKDWQSPVEVWKDILKAEQTNTQNLLRLAAVADQCGDYGCMAFLDPFHTEQIEAEDKVGSILTKLREAPELLRQLDFMLGQQAEEEEHGH